MRKVIILGGQQCQDKQRILIALSRRRKIEESSDCVIRNKELILNGCDFRIRKANDVLNKLIAIQEVLFYADINAKTLNVSSIVDGYGSFFIETEEELTTKEVVGFIGLEAYSKMNISIINFPL